MVLQLHEIDLKEAGLKLAGKIRSIFGPDSE